MTLLMGTKQHVELLNQPFYMCTLTLTFSLMMLSKTPMPYMSLHSWDKDSQKHPGRPDQPHLKQSTQEVQAEKAQKVTVQVEREALCAQNIQEVAEVESQMEVQLQEKLALAHHPPPNWKEKGYMSQYQDQRSHNHQR